MVRLSKTYEEVFEGDVGKVIKVSQICPGLQSYNLLPVLSGNFVF